MNWTSQRSNRLNKCEAGEARIHACICRWKQGKNDGQQYRAFVPGDIANESCAMGDLIENVRHHNDSHFKNNHCNIRLVTYTKCLQMHTRTIFISNKIAFEVIVCQREGDALNLMYIKQTIATVTTLLSSL